MTDCEHWGYLLMPKGRSKAKKRARDARYRDKHYGELLCKQRARRQEQS